MASGLGASASEIIGAEHLPHPLVGHTRLHRIVGNGVTVQLVGEGVMLERAIVVLLILKGFAQRKRKMNATLDGKRFIGEALAHCLDILFCETECLQIGKAVVSFAKVGPQLDCATIGGNATLLIAHRLQNMTQPNVRAG